MRNGFSLLEVMVSLFLMTLVLFGMDAVQLISLQKTKENYLLDVANNQIEIMAEKLLLGAKYKNILEQIKEWEGFNKTILPNSLSSVDINALSTKVQICFGKTTCVSKEIPLAE